MNWFTARYDNVWYDLVYGLLIIYAKIAYLFEGSYYENSCAKKIEKKVYRRTHTSIFLERGNVMPAAIKRM